jgi:hypothetical protein
MGHTLRVKIHWLFMSISKKPSYKHRLPKGRRLQDAAIYGNRLTVIMEISNTYQVLLIDVATGLLIDNFWTHFASLSPDGRFIVYKKWEGRNERSEFGRPIGVTVVYDVTKDPMANRTTIPKKHFAHILSLGKQLSALDYSTDAGLPVYPVGDYNKPEYGWGKTREESARVHDEYFWYQSSAFIFAITPKDKFTQIFDAVYNDERGQFDIKEYKVKSKNFMDTKDPADKYLPISHIEKKGGFIKLKTPLAIIRLNTLERLK